MRDAAGTATVLGVFAVGAYPVSVREPAGTATVFGLSVVNAADEIGPFDAVVPSSQMAHHLYSVPAESEPVQVIVGSSLLVVVVGGLVSCPYIVGVPLQPSVPVPRLHVGVVADG